MIFRDHCAFAFSLRIILIAYANIHDHLFAVPYTDIDYKVFTDAARHMVNGRSPFERHTYRYSPSLALLLTPNIFLHKDFGKVIFSLVDIVVAILMRRILECRNVKGSTANICAYLWLYNPLTVIISTRGNADSLAVLLVVLTVHLLQKERILVAGLVHGLSVHFRLYPIVFSLPMYLSLRKSSYVMPNRDQLKLVIGCVFTLFALTGLSYYLYGYKFLYESLLYHFVRKDTKHNFSVFFYMLYLSADQPPALYEKVLTFLPQLLLLLLLSYRYSNRLTLSFALFTQAMVMVIYNPVITSQYFFWFLSLLPLCLPNFVMSLRRSFLLILAWVASQGLWLFAAYLLEFKGINTFIFIWLASLVFFIVNIRILIDVIRSYKK